MAIKQPTVPNDRKGVVLTYSVFLLFSALLVFLFMAAHVAVMENDAYSAILSAARVRNQFDAVEYYLPRLPITDLNFTVNGSSILLVEQMPFNVTNTSTFGFVAFREFVENYSYINTTISAVHELPGELQIEPYRMSVIHPNMYSVVMKPLDNESSNALINYTFELALQGSTPSVTWAHVHEVPSNSSDALYVYATGYGSGDPGRLNILPTYINRSEYCRLEYMRGANLIMWINFNNGTIKRADIGVDPRFGIQLNSTISFNSNITETVGGMKPANITVSVPNALKNMQIVR